MKIDPTNVTAGDFRLMESGLFDGIVGGNMTVAAGLEVEMGGIVGGNLIVEAGAHVTLTGIVGGDLVSRGTVIKGVGIVGGSRGPKESAA